MSRNARIAALGSGLLAGMLAAAPALAQAYDYDYDGRGAGGVAAVLLFCGGLAALIALLLFVLNIWMLIDAATRQDWEFPSGDKTLWVVLLAAGLVLGFGTIVAIVYFFMVYRARPRGRGRGLQGYGGQQGPYGPPPAGPYGGPPPGAPYGPGPGEGAPGPGYGPPPAPGPERYEQHEAAPPPPPAAPEEQQPTAPMEPERREEPGREEP